jgi:DNA (cytosine-5)-methyltransferase 1
MASTGEISHCLNAGGMGRIDYETESMVVSVTGDITHALNTANSGKGSSEDGTALRASSGGGDKPHVLAFVPDVSPTLRAGGNATGGHRPPGTDVDTADSNIVTTSLAVRRLTPEECEALQSFPRGHTAVPYRRKIAADGPRYKAIGNSMCCNVMAWIGRRIAAHIA